MKIKKINMVSYGKFENKEISFSDGLNIISGNNESGKSTIMSFIRAMLYGFSGRGGVLSNDRKHYLPWGKTTLSGSADILLDNGKTVKVSRTSGKSQGFDKLECFDISNSEEYDFNPETEVGLGEDAFLKTLCIKQLQSNFSGEDDEISKKLINLTHSASEDINAAESLDAISSYMKKFKAARGGGGSIQSLQEEISAINLKISAAEQSRLAAFESIKKKQTLTEEIDNAKKAIADIKLKIETAKISELFSRLSSLKTKKREAEEKLSALGYEEKHLKEKLTSLSAYESEPPEIIFTAKEKTDGISAEVEALRKKASNLKVLTVISAVLCIISGALSPLSIYTLSGLVPFGALVVYSLVSGSRTKLKIREKENEAAEKEAYNEKIDNALKLYGVTDFRQYSENKTEFASAKTDYENTIEMINAVKSEISELDGEIEILSEKTAGHSPEDATYTVEELTEEEAAYNSLLEKYIAQSARIEGELGASPSEETLGTLIAQRAELIKRLDDATEEYSAAGVAFDILSEVFAEVRSDFTPLVNEKASEYLKELTNGSLDKIYLDKKFSVTAEKEGVHELSYFSLGTFDQTYLSIRLAMCDLLFGKDKPLFIDDSFVQYDAEREKKAFEILANRAAEGQQIIFFTCRSLPEFEGEKNLINLTI